MTLSYNLSHHGGNSTHAIWIKYFTIKCEVNDADIHLQTPIDQFLISIVKYQPVDFRLVKKTIKKSRNQSELEQNFAELFLFNEINIGNVFAFSRILAEKISSYPTPTNLGIISQVLMRGLIAFSYRFPDLINKYLNKEQMENFQAEYWELFHYLLQYLLKEPNAIFKETIPILLPILNAIDIKPILNLEDSDFLKIGLNTLISTLINCFPYELECGTSHIFVFLIQTLTTYSNQISTFSNIVEIVDLFGRFSQKLESVSNHVTDEQTQQIFTIFTNVIKAISNRDKNGVSNKESKESKEQENKEKRDENNDKSDTNNDKSEENNIKNGENKVKGDEISDDKLDKQHVNCFIHFVVHSLTCLPSYLPKYTNEQINEIVHSILSFLLWVTDTIPYDKIFQSVGEYQLFTTKTIEVKYNDWFSYFTDNILLPEKFTKQIKSTRVNNILKALDSFFKHSHQSLSLILDDFSYQISEFNEDSKFLILIFIFISLIKVKDLDTSDISESFFTSAIYDSAFPADLTVQIKPIALHYHEVYLKFLHFFTCHKAENLRLVLKIISKSTANNNFERMAHFLPLLRSLLLHDSQIQFIYFFLESGIIESIHTFLFISENKALIDQIASFYQLISITRPMEVFHSSSFLLALRNLVMIDRLQQLLAPCFKIGISLSYTTPFNVGKLCVHSTLEQIFSILKQEMNDPKNYNLALQLVTYLNETVELFDISVFVDLKGLFEEISKLPSLIQTSESFLECLTFFNKFCANYPQFLKLVNSNNSVIIRNFESAAPKIKITKEIINCLIALMLNEKEIKESKIKNRAALRLLLQISKETEFENFVLEFLLKTCRNSMFNNFECFSCDVIGFVLSRLYNHIQLSLELFKVIGSKFFSPLALNQTFKAMRLENGKRCNHHQKLLDTFQSMLFGCRLSPVTSFFHFGGDEEGVVVKNIDPVIFSEPYSIASIFKIEKFEEKFYPILTISENGKNSLLSFFMKSDMFVVQVNSHPGYVLRQNFVDSNWYKLIVVINPACIQVFINDTELGSIPIAKHDFRNEVTVIFGKKEQKSFSGDFGPTIFVKSTNLQEINEIYQKVNLSRIHMKLTFIKFLPWLVKDDKISDVVVDNDSYSFSGDAIPSCTNIAQMIHFEGTFQIFLPLFILLNYPIASHDETCAKDNDIIKNSNEFVNEDEQFFVSVLLTFETLLRLSEKLQKSFEKIGGFKLFAGFISHMRSEIFTAKIANHFELIFNVLKLKSLQIEMIEQIWLNFDLWNSMSYEFQLTIYSIIDKIWKKNQDLMKQKITPSFLLYQCSFLEAPKTKKKLMLFDLDQQIDNVPIELKNDQKIKIEKSQWKFFIDYTLSNPIASSFIDILMILSHHSDHHTQIFASEIIEMSLKMNINELYVATELTDEYEFFLNIFRNSKIIKLRANIMRCIFVLGVNERNGKIVLKSMKFKQALLILLQLLNTGIKSDKDKSILFKVCYSFIFEHPSNYTPKPQEISNPEALLPLFVLSRYVQREELVKYSLVLLNDFAQYSNSVSFILSIDSWPIWIFIFAFNSYDFVKDYHTFAYFFSIFFNSVLNNGRIDLINSFITFLDLLSIYVKIDFRLIKKDLIMHLILFSVQHKLNLDVSINLLVVALRFMFIDISFNFESDSEKVDELNYEFLLNFISKYQSPDSIEEVKNLEQKLNISYKDINSNDFDYVIEVLSLISTIMGHNHETQIEFNGILVNIFDLFSYLYLVLDKSDQETIKIRAQRYFQQVTSTVSSAVLDKFTAFSKEEFLNCLQRPDIVRDSYHTLLVGEATKISNSLQEMIQKPEDLERISNSLKKFEASYNCFVDVNSKRLLFASLYDDNMMISFIRYVTSSNGPWSTIDLSKSAINHWRATTKINENGHNIYWKLNRSFDDHKKASLLRDSMKIKPEEQQQLDIIPNFHRILNQNSPHIAMAKTEMKQEKTTSFKVTQFALLYHISGILHVNDRRIFFNGTSFVENLGDPDNVIKNRPHKFIEIPIHRISFVFQRRHQHCDIGAEIFTITNKSYFFIFESKEKRTYFLEMIKKMTTFDKSKVIQMNSLFAPMQIACGCCSQTINCQELVIKSKITKMWQERKITNFIYLLYLNLISGRSFNDISQYPVYPWILSDYESDSIDLNDPKIYRDLSKPISAYNEERLEGLQKNMSMEDPYQRCFYRTFFSNPSAVAGYLIRTEPFTTLHIRLQGNKFDLPTRLFNSVFKAWDSVTGKVNDFRELIPEFFCSHHFLVNENGFDLGKNVNDVQLPNWASSPHEFISVNRMALESDYVSSHLEKWIDLIFGADQISVEKNNVYHLFSYTDSLPSEIIDDPEMFFVAQNHALNFGVCPTKLFVDNHPNRNETQNFGFPHSNSSGSINSLTNVNQQNKAKIIGSKSPLRPTNSVSIPSLAAEINLNQQGQFLDSIESGHLVYQIPTLDSPIVCMRKGCVLTSKPTLFNVSINTVHHLVGLHTIKEGQLIDFDGTFLYEVSRGGTYVSVISIKTGEEVGILPHNNYEVTCISCIENRAILVCGTDCAIDIWKVSESNNANMTTSFVSDVSMTSMISSPTDAAAVAVGNSIVYLGTIISHSMPIVAAVGNCFLDIIVSIDEGSNIVISTLRERKFIHTFKVDCFSNSVHFLKILLSGVIVLSSQVPGGKNSEILFFDFCGNTLGKIQNDSYIEALDVICAKDMQEFVVISTSSKSINIYECSDFKMISHFTNHTVPRFISFIESEQRAVLVVKVKQKKYELAVLEF